MPDVKVFASNVATGIAFHAHANTAGVYHLLFLTPGTYTISAEVPGFKKAVSAPFQLEVSQIARIDIAMELGDLTQAVDVTAYASILQRESAAAGETITSSELAMLPLNGRNFATLITFGSRGNQYLPG